MDPEIVLGVILGGTILLLGAASYIYWKISRAEQNANLLPSQVIIT